MAEGDYDAALKALDEAGGSQPDPQAPVTEELFPELPPRENGCPFCTRIAAGKYDEALSKPGCYVFEPLNPVTPGHLLVVPGEHVRDAAVAPATASAVMFHAALTLQRLGGNANIITSIGAAATQTVPHLHVHLVPRFEGDGLHLPWTAQGHILTDYAVCWGSEDPNDCGGPIPGRTGMLTYDDEDEARGMTQYIGGSYVARREVTQGRWERVDEGKPDEAAPARSRHGQMAAEQPPVDTRTRVRPREALSGDPGAAEGHSL